MYNLKTRLCRKSEHFFSKAKKMVTVSFTDERMNETLTFPRVWCAMAFALVMFFGAFADAQLADLDLLEDDDRSFGASVTAMPDPQRRVRFAESRSAILLLPLRIKRLHFEGGAGTYFTQSIVEGEVASALQWRVQGGPHWGKIGIQFYVEGLMEARHRLCGLRAFW